MVTDVMWPFHDDEFADGLKAHCGIVSVNKNKKCKTISREKKIWNEIYNVISQKQIIVLKVEADYHIYFSLGVVLEVWAVYVGGPLQLFPRIYRPINQ